MKTVKEYKHRISDKFDFEQKNNFIGYNIKGNLEYFTRSSHFWNNVFVKMKKALMDHKEEEANAVDQNLLRFFKADE